MNAKFSRICQRYLQSCERRSICRAASGESLWHRWQPDLASCGEPKIRVARAALAKSGAMAQSDEETPPAWVYSYNAGVEVEAAGRSPAKNWLTLRRDLAALPWLLAGPHDVVLAPPQRPAFLAALRASGAHGLPDFLPAVPAGRAIAGHRPYGVPGEHLRRSLVARWREDVAVCRTSEEVRVRLRVRVRVRVRG